MKKLIVLSILLLSVCYGTTINVPADSTTIQAGINGAEEGDTVLVAAGTYIENITWSETNGIKLIGSGENDCFIDGNSLGRVISFYKQDVDNIIDSTTLITGFTIQNGSDLVAGSSAGGGGGMYLNYSSPTLTDVIIRDNTAHHGGGGMFLHESAPYLVDVTFSNNSGSINDAWTGGGMYLKNSNPNLRGVTFNGNTASYGGGMALEYSSPTLMGVTFINNTVTYDGGGMHLHSSSPILTSATFSGNTADRGGGIYVTNSSLTLINSILWDDSPNEIDSNDNSNPPNTIEIKYSDIHGGWYGLGNINSNPLFSDSENDDYTLQIGSPCIDAGIADTWVDDIEDYCGSNPDMGAYEYITETCEGECEGEIEIDVCGVCGGNGPTEGLDCDGNELSVNNTITPDTYIISSIYPNPFNPVTSITYGLPEYTNVQIVVYNLSGKQIESLINEFQSSGYHSINWNADNHPSGMYFVKMIAGEYVNTQKLMLIK